MKKEVFTAIFLGLFLGLIVTYGIYRASQADTQQQVASLLDVDLEVEQTTLENGNNGVLVINTPSHESVVSEQRQTISGNTLSNSFIVIYVNETPYITTADESGAFSLSADLRLGANIIGVHALNENGDETISEITVAYTTQPLLSGENNDETTEND